MAVRILMLLLSIIIATNLVIMLVSFICGVNLYKKHGKVILNCFGIFILLIVIIYITLAILGLT